MAAQALSPVDFGFEDLRNRMTRFTVCFDEFIEKGRKRILEEKNEFARNAVEDKEYQRSLKSEITEFSEKEKAISDNVAKEEVEALETERAIAEMTRKKQLKVDHKKQLLSQIEETRHAIGKKRTVLSAERRVLSSQVTRNLPELAFWEEHLGMRIEGVGVADHLKIVYTHIIDSDWTKEFFFVVSMVTRDYEIIKFHPKVNCDKMNRLVEKLNETRGFTVFLKEMRHLFKCEFSAA